MSYQRTFSVIRRRPHLIDLVTPRVYGIATYRLKWAQSFDGVFANIAESSNVGWIDPAVDPRVVEMRATPDQVRIVFDPATYGITDTQSFWLELFRIDGAGVPTQVSAPTLILPDAANHGVGQVTIHGNAPNAASVAGSLQLDFPRLMQDFRIHNELAAGGNNLYVATEADGPESQLQPDTFPQYSSFNATQGSIWVRGGGGAVPFSAIFTAAFPR